MVPSRRRPYSIGNRPPLPTGLVLVRILHYRQLALRRRVSLYLSCVRSSLIFGLHATGLTPATLRKLDALDSRHLRAIANSPSHLTHESTLDLRLRLRVQSPEEAIVALLRRRIACCQEEASVVDMQSHLSALLSCTHTPDDEQPRSGIVPCYTQKQIACPVCGVYFDSMRHMLSHQARQHKRSLAPEPQPKSTAYPVHTINGLPQCKHCFGVFTRVEALTKHLQRSCPVLHGGTVPRRDDEEATGSGVLGATDREGSLGHSCRLPQAAVVESPSEPVSQSTEPLITDPSFLRALSSGWRLAAASADFQQVLRKHCVYCHQWVSLSLKQHCRLTHPEHWQHKHAANSLCSSAGLSSASPCTYCGVPHKDPRAHVKHCPVLFQFALAFDPRPGFPLRWR